eukprot:scaffold5682_cov52-Attheya_sp.AAC.2
MMEYDPMFVAQILTPGKKGNWFRQHHGFVAWRRPQFEESEGAPLVHPLNSMLRDIWVHDLKRSHKRVPIGGVWLMRWSRDR